MVCLSLKLHRNCLNCILLCWIEFQEVVDVVDVVVELSETDFWRGAEPISFMQA